MANINSRDIEAIKEWMAKEDHLPKDFTEMMYRKFLHSCHGSLEQTKQCIEKFCAGRLNMPEIFTNRDPLAAKMQTAYSITDGFVPVCCDDEFGRYHMYRNTVGEVWLAFGLDKSVASYNVGNQELLIHQLDDPNLEKFEFYEILKSFSTQVDYWIHNHPVYADSHIFLLDIQHFYLKIIPKVNVFFFRHYLLYVLESMPLRLKQIHVFNCPPYYEKLYALVKTVLPQKICNIVFFHNTIEGVHKVLDKKYLPTELGGEASSLRKQTEEWVTKIEASRKTFLDDNMWKASPTKKTKSNTVDNSMSGSFKTLTID